MKVNKAALNDAQRTVVKLIETLVGKYSSWEIWQDFISMSAVAIANSCPGAFNDEREQIYLQRAERYTSKELSIFAEMLAMTIDAIITEPDQDFLGNLFMALGLGDHWKGQFFTPYSLCQCMARFKPQDEIKQEIQEKSYTTVLDPACGAGALLIAYANYCRSINIDVRKSVVFVGQDLDSLAAMMCYIQLSLMGCPGYVKVGDSFSDPVGGTFRSILLPESSFDIWETPVFQDVFWLPVRLKEKMKLGA